MLLWTVSEFAIGSKNSFFMEVKFISCKDGLCVNFLKSSKNSKPIWINAYLAKRSNKEKIASTVQGRSFPFVSFVLLLSLLFL